MTEIAIEPIDDQRFGVVVTEGDVTTHHEFDVEPEEFDDLLLGETPREEVVAETIDYLLDTFTVAELPKTLSLRALRKEYEEYDDELRERVGVG